MTREGERPHRVLLQVVVCVVVIIDDIAVGGQVQPGRPDVGVQGVAGLRLADADPAPAAYGWVHRGHRLGPAHGRVHPVEGRSECARDIHDVLLLGVHPDGHVGLDHREAPCLPQRERGLVAASRMLPGGDGMLTAADDHDQRSPRDQPPHPPARAESRGDHRADRRDGVGCCSLGDDADLVCPVDRHGGFSPRWLR